MAPETRIKLTGFSDAAAIEAMCASELVDIAYVDEINGSAMYLVPDSGIDFDNPDDVRWLRSILESKFRRIGEPEIHVEVDRAGEVPPE